MGFPFSARSGLLRLPGTGEVEVLRDLRAECRRSPGTGARGAGVIAGIVIDGEVASRRSCDRHRVLSQVLPGTSRRLGRAVAVVHRIDIGRQGGIGVARTSPRDHEVLALRADRRGQVEVLHQVGHRGDGDRGLRLFADGGVLHQVVHTEIRRVGGVQARRTETEECHHTERSDEEHGEARSHHARYLLAEGCEGTTGTERVVPGRKTTALLILYITEKQSRAVYIFSGVAIPRRVRPFFKTKETACVSLILS